VKRARPSRALAWLFSGLLMITAATSASTARAEPEPSPERALPDYSGRPEPTTAGDVLLWIPRILLSPLYLISEFVIRRPLEFLVSAAERSQLPEALYDFFLFGPDHGAGVLPIAFVDFGFYPSVGLYFFWNNIAPNQDLKLRASFWGTRWLSGNASYRFRLNPLTDLTFAAGALRRPDNQFYGLGSESRRADRSRYGMSRLTASVALEIKLSEYSRLTSTVGIRRVHFHRGGGFDDDPRLEDLAAAGRFPLPPGYEDGYTGLYDSLDLAIDTRRPRPASTSGVRVEARVEQLSELRPGATGFGILRYGASAGGFWDIAGSGRVLSLSVITAFADSLRRGMEVPFTELAFIGGDVMRGFPPGRGFGRSAAVATLRYRWPVWMKLDGSLQFALGNVFDAHLQNFAPELLRISTSIGIESVGAPDSSLELLFGFGTETFKHGTSITSFRVVVGSNHGF